MKKSIKILTVIVGILIFLTLLAAILVSPIAENYIEKHSKELTGRVITMEKFRFNILNGHLKTIGFEMKEQDDKSTFFKFDSLKVEIKLLDFLWNKVSVNKIYVKNAYLYVNQNGEKFNFDDLLTRFMAEDTTSAIKDTSSYEIALKDIELNGGNILYEDLQIKSKWDLKNLKLKIPEVYFNDKSTDVGISLAFADGGTLISNIKYDLNKSAYDISLKLNKFSITGITPYVQQYFKIGSLSGLLAADVSIKGDVEHIMGFNVSGAASVSDFNMEDDRGLNLMQAARASVKMSEINLENSRYILDELRTEGVKTSFVMEKDSSNNFSYIFRDDLPVESDTTSAPIKLIINNLITENTLVELVDKTLTPPFRYKLDHISVTAQKFDIDKQNQFRIKGNVGKTGSAIIRWSGSMDDMSNQSLFLNIINLNLKEFTPYALQYFAYPISKGNASFKTKTVIKNNNIESVNNLDIFKIEVDKKNKELKPEYKIPMKTALYILKDKNDRIQLDLPVKGNINDPQFSYKKVIIKVFVNLIVKVATAPVSFLADALGLSGDKLTNIAIDEMQRNFTTEQYESFNELAQMSLSKPELQMELVQVINYDKAFKDQALSDLKRAYTQHTNPGQIEVETINDNDPKLTAFADSLCAPVKIEGSAVDKALHIYKDQIAAQVAELAQKRDEIIKEYFITRLMVKPESFRISTIPYEAGKATEDKSKYKINFIMPGDSDDKQNSVVSD